MRIPLGILVLLLTSSPALAELRLANVFSDHMVVQAGQPITIWGWSDPGSQVAVQFDAAMASGQADADGAWRVTLPAAVATEDSFATHFMAVTSGQEELILRDILVGEVWLASGQSNMEMQLGKSDSVEEVLGAGPYPGLRMFTVARTSQPEAAADVQGAWGRAEGEAMLDFSAVALHFGLDLIEALDRPVGIVHSSWGGSSVEAWLSRSALLGLEGDPGGYALWEKSRIAAAHNREHYSAQQLAPGDQEGWGDCSLPIDFEQLEPAFDGAIWFRSQLVLPDDWSANAGHLSLGAIDDEDEVWIDGVRLGGTLNHLEQRKYGLTPEVCEVLSDGRAQIAIRVMDTGGWGGFSGKADEIALVDGVGKRLPLTTGWSWRRGATAAQAGENHRPAHLYQGMLAPLLGLQLAGCIWYQGESNANDPEAYAKLFPALIHDWREKLGKPKLPFFWVQLASYSAWEGSDWPALREAQRRTLELVDHGGMAVTIDVGDANDIHPRDKHSVGSRLARWALFDTYQLNGIGDQGSERSHANGLVVPSGPLAQGAKLDGRSIVVTFETYGSPIRAGAADGTPGGFELAGPDGIWHLAEAVIEDGAVRVASASVAEPNQVRYAWSDVPATADLENEAGLPASPFRYKL